MNYARVVQLPSHVQLFVIGYRVTAILKFIIFYREQNMST